MLKAPQTQARESKIVAPAFVGKRSANGFVPILEE